MKKILLTICKTEVSLISSMGFEEINVGMNVLVFIRRMPNKIYLK